MGGFFTKKHEDFKDQPTTGEIMGTVNPAFSELTFEGKIPSVSFSTLSNFTNCPYSVYLSKVKNGGIGNVGSPAMDRGSEIHQMLEDYVKGDVEFVDWYKIKSKDYYIDMIEKFREEYKENLIVPEMEIALREDLSPCGWTDKDVWFRGAIDIARFNKPLEEATEATLYDYKTGGYNHSAKHRSQLQLYALLILQLYPKIEKVSVAAIYLDHRKELFFNSFGQSDVRMIWPRTYAKLKSVTDATVFYPNANGYTCKWCQHKTKQEKLGQDAPACEFAHVPY